SAYNTMTVTPGWRYGLAAMTSTGDLFAGAPERMREGQANILPPRDTVREYLIVVGTPKEWVPNPWDEDERTDAQFPFRYKIIDKTEGM
ncbi:MAG: hypothetical protein IJ662_12515, partial [Clostridia bacterium]|nr:hypothetical protein [Clostridia bacterium]